MRNIILFGICLILWSACDGDDYGPKPRTYPRIVYPEGGYTDFNEGFCPFTFQKPVYATVEHDTTFFDRRAPSDCWFNLAVPSLNAKVYFSYYPIKDRAGFDELIKDAFEMTNKHNVKASFIEEISIARPKDNVHGIVFNVDGPVASPYQFFLTDSSRHFVRGALYFNTQSKPDSLAPVIAFMKRDVNMLVETLQWKK
jgi:gliding motility-associated lipoprotein GldD